MCFLVYKIKSFSLYSDFRWNGFSKTKEFRKQLSFAIMYIYFFLYKNNFMRTKPFNLAKKIKNKAKNKVRHAEHKSKVSRLAILKIIRAKHQNRAWLSLILYYIHVDQFYSHALNIAKFFTGHILFQENIPFKFVCYYTLESISLLRVWQKLELIKNNIN